MAESASEAHGRHGLVFQHSVSNSCHEVAECRVLNSNCVQSAPVKTKHCACRAMAAGYARLMKHPFLGVQQLQATTGLRQHAAVIMLLEADASP